MKFIFFKPRELEDVTSHKLPIVVECWLCNPTEHHHTSIHMVFRNLSFRFQGFRGFSCFRGVEYRERKVAVRTVRALVTKKKKNKRNQTQSWGGKIEVRADKMLGKESVRKALTFCTLHINNFQKDSIASKPQPHDPLNSRPLHSFLFLRTLLPIVNLSIFLYLTETVHKTNDPKGEKTLLLGSNRRARRTTTPARTSYTGKQTSSQQSSPSL
jgi:hypothetical protein